MKEEEFYELIDKLNQKVGIANSNDSISWHAHRTVEKMSDESFYPILIKIVGDNRQAKNKAIRKAAYYIIGTMLRNVFNKEVCWFLIQQLGAENDKYILSDILECLSKFSIPQEFDISLIIEHSKSEKWLIRHSAINALGSSASQESRQALLYYLYQDDEDKFKYEIIYSNCSLGKIGTEADIPFLQKHINSRKRDIRISAKIAIEKISQKSQT